MAVAARRMRKSLCMVLILAEAPFGVVLTTHLTGNELHLSGTLMARSYGGVQHTTGRASEPAAQAYDDTRAADALTCGAGEVR